MTVTVVINKLTTFASSALTALERIGRPLWKILTFCPADEVISPKKVLSVSIEKGGLSIAFGSRFLSRIKIKGLRRYLFEEDRYPQPEGLASSVALAINILKAAKTDVTLGIPKAWAIIKTVEFPSTVKENLPYVLSNELDRLTPFSSEDSLYDFRVLKDEAEKLTLLVMAAKADTIRPYLDALRERGLNVSRVTVNLSCMGTLCHYFDKETDALFIEIDENGYEGALFLDGSITDAFTDSFSTGDEKSRVDTILKEISPIMEAAKKQGSSPQVMLLIKDKSPSLRELLKLHINQPVRILNETDIKLSLPEHQQEVSYAPLGGVLESLWPKAKGLNLIKKGHHETQKTPIALSAVLMLTIFFMGILYMVAPLRIEKKRLVEIDHQIMLRKEEVRNVETLKNEIESLNNEISIINDFKVNRPTTLDILSELTQILPQNTWLTRVRITEATVNIEGYSDSATGLLPKLEASKYFKKTGFASPTFRDRRQNADRFIIKMETEGIKRDRGEDEEE